MTSVLNELLWRLNCNQPHLFGYPEHGFDLGTLESHGLLVPTVPNDFIVCQRCDEMPRIDIRWKTRRDGSRILYFNCPCCGRYRADPDRLRQWIIPMDPLLERLRDSLGIRGQIVPLIPKAVWRLGQRHGLDYYYVFRGDVPDMRSLKRFFAAMPKAVVFTGRSTSRELLEAITAFPIFVMEELVRFDENYRFIIDMELVDEGIRAVWPEECAKNLFTKRGAWFWKFNGKETVLPGELLGAFYLQHLVKYPERDIHVSELLAEVMGEEQLRVSSGGQEVIDEEARKSYKKRLEVLAEERRKADANGDDGWIERIDSETERISDELFHSVGLRQRSRKIGDEVQNLRRRIAKTIGEVKDKIRENDPELARHFDCGIYTGTYMCYRPDRKVDWLFR